ncbi:hypothetical protein AV530_007755 [Patagioenas fasciata monilis]|uniref:Uncharacterized protein n=1 Tax=Patagioenas fasciata monilis TaxID=372326 RepID=A0A1V4JZ04_PATFA|nr:hypothetical protein AV530_007755 [Patagioenas fasciata monilis]
MDLNSRAVPSPESTGSSSWYGASSAKASNRTRCSRKGRASASITNENWIKHLFLVDDTLPDSLLIKG